MADTADIIPFQQEETEVAPAFSEEAIALNFAEAFQDTLRYVALFGKWFRYASGRWAPDSTLAAFDDVRRLCRDYANAAGGNERQRAAIASASTFAAVERLARSDRRLAATVDQWDAERLLLNTPAGVVNLTTGVLSNHNPQYFFTKMTAVAPEGDCPQWLAVIARATGESVELQRYLRRLFGYTATGSTKEQALFFGHGHGANSKSIIFNTVANILGDYAKTAPIETFTASTFDRHPTELAGLHGARLVTAVETEEGRQFAESRIKAITGGDKLAVRFMRQDFFEYTPQFKLVIVGNHKPGLRSVDEAIRRRFNLIPFEVTIPPSERDRDLAEKLKAEWPGILKWIVAGAIDWWDHGLQPPPIVTKATDTYLDQQDSLTAWTTENCQIGAEYRDTAKRLFGSWSHWAQGAGVPAGKRTTFLDSLRKKGFEDRHTNIGTTFFGLRVTPSMLGDDHE